MTESHGPGISDEPGHKCWEAGVTGKTIRISLADGEATGIPLAEISNWTGKLLVAPRSQLDQFSKRERVRRTGVYLLVGPDPDDPSRALASTGEGDNVLRAAAPPEPERGQGLLGAPANVHLGQPPAT